MKKEEKVYWILHTLWWMFFQIYITFPSYKIPVGGSLAVSAFLISHLGTFFLLSHFYRIIYKRLNPQEKSLKVTIIAPIIGIIILGSIFYFINAYGFPVRNPDGEPFNIMEYNQFEYYFECLYHICPWFFLFHLYQYARISFQKDEQLLEASSLLQKTELMNLKSELNPHFLFNALNGIKSLMLTDIDTSRNAITQLSDLLRVSLKISNLSDIKLEVEIKLVQDYLSIEKIRFENRLVVNYDVPPELYQCDVVPMTIQLLVENAVKHGIGQSKSGGEILISAKNEDDSLILKVANTGKLIQENRTLSTSSGIGMKNLEKRLKLRFGEKISLKISESGNWVSAEVSFPYSQY